jgi:predicted Zn-dependent protease with MMP-like domain
MTASVYRRILRLAEREVKQAQESLSGDLAEKAKILPVIFEPCPGKELVLDGVEPDLLGLFSGSSFPEGLADDSAPPTVHVFLENLWEYCEEDEGTFIEEVRITYLHELGHYLGLEENDLERRGLA